MSAANDKTETSEEQSILQRFFDASLIPSETTDERLIHYQTAAADLAKRFDESPLEAVSASRVAIDPNCPATDPWFDTVQDAVKVHWKTFLVKSHDAPRQVCRAILLEALSKATGKDWTAHLAIWNATSSLLPHLGEGPEQNVTREFITDLGVECEEHSSSEWSIGETAGEVLPAFELELPAIKVIEVNEAELTNGFGAAAGPNNEKSEPYENANKYWSNSAQNWSYQFAPRAANAVAKSVNKALTSTTPAIKALNAQLAPALKEHGNALGGWVVESAKRNERFTALLWWKQALYSPSLQRSYRELSPTSAAIALSFDLGSVSGAPVPLSVEYFLREMIYDLFPENPKLTLAELITATEDSELIDSCLPSAPVGAAHRVSLREYLMLTRQVAPDEETIPAYTGLVSTTKLPVSEWTVWLLRECLSEILTAPEV